jgi:hypothetical protein
MVFASGRSNGIIEIHDAGFATALRALAQRDSIAEIP